MLAYPRTPNRIEIICPNHNPGLARSTAVYEKLSVRPEPFVSEYSQTLALLLARIGSMIMRYE